MQWTIYPTIERAKLNHARMNEDEIVSVIVDMNSEVTRLSTSVSTATWTTERGNLSIGSKALSSNVATAQFTALNLETALVKLVLTLADGQKFNVFWEIRVRDPIVNPTANIFGVP